MSTTTAEAPTPGFTPYRYAEDYTDTELAGLCLEHKVVAGRTFVCVAPAQHRGYNLRDHHGMIRLHRDPSIMAPTPDTTTEGTS